jgi:hypothetical protein
MELTDDTHKTRRDAHVLHDFINASAESLFQMTEGAPNGYRWANLRVKWMYWLQPQLQRFRIKQYKWDLWAVLREVVSAVAFSFLVSESYCWCFLNKRELKELVPDGVEVPYEWRADVVKQTKKGEERKVDGYGLIRFYAMSKSYYVGLNQVWCYITTGKFPLGKQDTSHLEHEKLCCCDLSDPGLVIEPSSKNNNRNKCDVIRCIIMDKSKYQLFQLL